MCHWFRCCYLPLFACKFVRRDGKRWRWSRSKRTNAPRVRLIDFLFASLAATAFDHHPRENTANAAHARSARRPSLPVYTLPELHIPPPARSFYYLTNPSRSTSTHLRVQVTVFLKFFCFIYFRVLLFFSFVGFILFIIFYHSYPSTTIHTSYIHIVYIYIIQVKYYIPSSITPSKRKKKILNNK